MDWGSWKSMGPRRAWSRGSGRAGHPAASVGRNLRAGLIQRPAPPRHGGTWRDPAWGGFVLRRYFGEPPHKTGCPNPPRRPATQNCSNLGHSASSSWAAKLAGTGTVTARSSSASWSTRGRPARQVSSAPARRRATPLPLRRWAESGCSPPRPPPRTPPIWPKSSTWRRQSRQAFCHSWSDNYGGHPPATARPTRANVKKELEINKCNIF